jgi:hypothetical protein
MKRGGKIRRGEGVDEEVGKEVGENDLRTGGVKGERGRCK